MQPDQSFREENQYGDRRQAPRLLSVSPAGYPREQKSAQISFNFSSPSPGIARMKLLRTIVDLAFVNE